MIGAKLSAKSNLFIVRHQDHQGQGSPQGQEGNQGPQEACPRYC